jgi:hypothetical protein
MRAQRQGKFVKESGMLKPKHSNIDYTQIIFLYYTRKVYKFFLLNCIFLTLYRFYKMICEKFHEIRTFYKSRDA